jgi:hypothetical protein
MMMMMHDFIFARVREIFTKKKTKINKFIQIASKVMTFVMSYVSICIILNSKRQSVVILLEPKLKKL